MDNKINKTASSVIQDSENNTENNFLEEIKERKEPIKIYLVSGLCLHGFIVDFDKHVIKLTQTNGSLIIYKTAIASIAAEKYIKPQKSDENFNKA